MDKSKYDDIVQMWINTVQENNSTDCELALEYCDKLIQYGKGIKDDSLIGFAYYNKAVVHYVLNDGNNFFYAVTEALSYLSKADEWLYMARCYNFLGISAISRGNVVVALDYYISSIEYCKKAQSDSYASVVHMNVGVLEIYCGRYDDALERFQISYSYFSHHPEMPNYDDYMIALYENMAKAYLFKGDLIESKCCFERLFAEHREYCDDASLTTVLCTEAMYYHIVGNDKKCDENINRVYNVITDEMPILDMFDDFYDYCKMLITREKDMEFWQMMGIMEPKVQTLGIVDLQRRLLALKLKVYRKNNQTAEYLEAAGLYYELSEKAEVEDKNMMNSVLNLRKTLEQVNREKVEVEKKNVMLRERSETDALTGLSNRFKLNDYSEEVFQRALEQKIPLAVEILDIDSFKGYNDFYGHQRGDECIAKVAGVVKSMEEFGAFTARYGGDEFILIYENVTKDQVVNYAAELRKRVMDLNIEHHSSRVCPVVSITQGVCWDIPVEGNRMWDYLQMADDMLYRTKQRKRNNFCIGNLTGASDQIVMSYL